MQNKDVGIRIRVGRELRDAFQQACQAHDLKASEVLRAFMRAFVDQQTESKQKNAKQDSVFGTRRW